MKVLLSLFLLTFSLHAEDWKTLVAQGEILDAQMKTRDAPALFLEAEKLEPNHPLLLSRIAKQYGESMTDTTDTAKKL